jgi:hypothetical protein
LTLFAARPAPDDSRDFMLLQQEPPDPLGNQTITMVSAIAGRVLLSRDQGTEQRPSSVQLLQNVLGDAGEPPVRLYVQQLDAGDPQKDLHLDISAPNFTQLWLKHRREVELYLRPILRDFGQDASVLSVPSSVAWQVLAEGYTPDAELTRGVEQLVVQLNADEFRQREGAEQRLLELGPPAAVVLSRLDRSALSPQQGSSVDSILARFMPLQRQEVLELRDDTGFLIDVLGADDASLRKLALDRLSKLHGKSITFDANLDSTRRQQAIEKLREELIPSTQPSSQPSSP